MLNEIFIKSFKSLMYNMAYYNNLEFFATPYIPDTYIYTHTHVHTTTVIRVYITPCNPATIARTFATSRHPPSPSRLFLSFSSLYAIYIFLLFPIYTFSLSLSFSLYILYLRLPLCNKSPLPTPGGDGRALSAASRIGSVSTLYERSRGNPTLAAGKGEALSIPKRV